MVCVLPEYEREEFAGLLDRATDLRHTGFLVRGDEAKFLCCKLVVAPLTKSCRF